MPDSSNLPTQRPVDPASSADFSTKSTEAKITSYMWYIHVLVRVNTEDRLRGNLAPFLGQETITTTAAAASPPYSPSLDLGDITSGGGGGSALGHEGDGSRAANKMDDLTDYLILRYFSRVVLEELVDTAPVKEHTDGYAQVLSGIPTHFREEFCRRLYSLLFSKRIVEWPSGIDVPEPAPEIAASATASAGTDPEAAPGDNKSDTSRVRIKEEEQEEEDSEGIEPWPTTEDENMSDDDQYHVEDERRSSPGYQSRYRSASPWPDTPSLGYSPGLARAAYFGTASSPLPMNYFSNWRLSRNGYGPARDAYAYAGAGAGAGRGEGLLPPSRDANQHHQQPVPPHTTPQDRPVSLVDSGRGQPQSHRQQQQVSHTGSYCPCCVREAWWDGEGAQR